MKKIVFFNTKGGTGKTTFCFNYGYYLAAVKKKKVLMMDFDPQANLTFTFGESFSKNAGKNLDSLVLDCLKDEKKNIKDYTFSIASGLSLLPCSNNISLIEEYLTNRVVNKAVSQQIKNPATERNNIFLNILNSTVKPYEYNYILIDSQPNFSLLSTTAIVFAENILVVLKPDSYSISDFEYLKKITSNLNKKFSSNIDIAGLIINAYEGRKNIAVSTVKEIKEKYGSEFKIFNQKIKYLSQYQNSIFLKNEPVFISYPKSEASENMLSLFSEIDKEMMFSKKKP
ncbi:MAG: ParA family protein [Candidatus Humimicrobiaceae bacterium]